MVVGLCCHIDLGMNMIRGDKENIKDKRNYNCYNLLRIGLLCAMVCVP